MSNDSRSCLMTLTSQIREVRARELAGVTLRSVLEQDTLYSDLQRLFRHRNTNGYQLALPSSLRWISVLSRESTVFTRLNTPGVHFKLGIVNPAFI